MGFLLFLALSVDALDLPLVRRGVEDLLSLAFAPILLYHILFDLLALLRQWHS